MKYLISILAVICVVTFLLNKKAIMLWYDDYKSKAYYNQKGFKFSDWHSIKLSAFKIIHLIVSNFLKKEITLRAASLTYFTFTSIVPVLALINLMVGYFANENSVPDILKDLFHDNSVLSDLNSLSNDYLKNEETEFNLKMIFSIVGLFALSFWGMLRLVMTIEGCANQLWEHEDRPILNQILNAFFYYVIAVAIFLAASKYGIIVLYPLLLLILFVIIKYSPHQKVKKMDALLGTAVSFVGILILNSDLVRGLMVDTYNSTYGFMGSLAVLLVSLDIFWIILLTGICISYLGENEAKEFMQKECRELAPAYESFLTIYIASIYYRNEHVDFDNIAQKLRRLNLPNTLLTKINNKLVRLGYLNPSDKTLGKADSTVGDLMYDLNFSGSFNMKYNFTDLAYWNDEYKGKIVDVFANLKTKLRDLDLGEVEALREMTPSEARQEDEAEHEKLNDLYKTLKSNVPLPSEPMSREPITLRGLLVEKVKKGLGRIGRLFAKSEE